MVKILTIASAIVCVMMVGCQGTGVSREELNEVKSEIKEIQDYLVELSAHYDRTVTIQDNLIKLQLKIPPEARAVILKGIEADTQPEPRPPGPPGGSIETRP
ncbi:MAG: hypothetical protein JSW49_02655 [candidate division WOR-3 bacterium]|nr:MAG: hypothetical protein JSW49_02655 [candidate division WOR-3 bacterium]